MNIVVYGVHHWPNREPTQLELDRYREWYDRIVYNIPYISSISIATGCYSNPAHSPFPPEVNIIQNKVPYTKEYSKEHNYFRNGFVSGVWYNLLNRDNWDVLLHIQSRVFIGDKMDKIFDDFYTMPQQVIAPNLICQAGSWMEISFFGMKPIAAMKYITEGCRYTFDNRSTDMLLNCEEEAYIMYNKTWFNPWPDILTTRQIDSSTRGYGMLPEHSPFTLGDNNEAKRLPLISTGKHVTDEFMSIWREEHPYEPSI